MLHEIPVSELKINPFTLIGKDWSLITAGDETGCNTMTASWGSLGVLWNKNIVTVYVRPQRYTKEFLDRFENFTVSFYEEDQREALTLCGRKSGRDLDKIAASGLTPVHENGTTYFSEAKLVLECKKLYLDRLDPQGFLAPDLDPKNYPNQDYHFVYIGEITRVLTK